MYLYFQKMILLLESRETYRIILVYSIVKSRSLVSRVEYNFSMVNAESNIVKCSVVIELEEQ